MGEKKGRNTSKLVKLEGEGDGEEYELIGDSDEKCYRQVIFV